MAGTTPNAALKGSRRHIFSMFIPAATVVTTDQTRYFVGSAAIGLAIGAPFRVVSMQAFGDVTEASADATFTAGVYKNADSAGNKSLETTLTLSGVAVDTDTDTSSANAGMDEFSETDTLVIKYVFDATADSVTIQSLNLQVVIEFAD